MKADKSDVTEKFNELDETDAGLQAAIDEVDNRNTSSISPITTQVSTMSEQFVSMANNHENRISQNTADINKLGSEEGGTSVGVGGGWMFD